MEKQRKLTPILKRQHLWPRLNLGECFLTFIIIYFRILSCQALNSAGVGPFSSTAKLVTPPSSPSGVVSLRASATAETIALTWKAPICNGSEVVSYNIDLGEKHQISVGNVLDYVIKDLLPETTYKWVQAIDPFHRCGRPQAACREPAGSYDKTTQSAICFEHKTQYLLIRAPYTRIVVFWHTSNTPPMISQSQISCNSPTFCIAAIFVKYCYTTGSWLL